jgi:uncharacterized protein (DUF2147 family)
MRKFALATVLMLTSSAAYAGSAFEIPINGGVARIRINDNCRETMCASVSWSERGSRGHSQGFKIPGISSKTLSKMFDGQVPNLKSFTSGDDDDGDDGDAGEHQPSRPAARSKHNPAALASAPASVPSDEPQFANRPASAPSPALAPTPTAPAEPSVPARAPNEEAAPSVTPSSPPVAAPAAKVAAVAPASKAKASRNSPVGEWLVEDGKSQIRIEECGANLCGFVSVGKKPNEKDRKNPNPSLRGRSVIGMPVLINMKPHGNRWDGRIYNAENGKTYTGNIRLKNASTLRVEGCAFGGLICGGQNWSRVN